MLLRDILFLLHIRTTTGENVSGAFFIGWRNVTPYIQTICSSSLYTHTYIHTHTHMHAHAHMYTHTTHCPHTHTHTPTHTHTHTHTNRTKRNFGDERFHYFMVLVGLQCIINAAFAKISKSVMSVSPPGVLGGGGGGLSHRESSNTRFSSHY